MDKMLVSVFVDAIHEQSRFGLIAEQRIGVLVPRALNFDDPEDARAATEHLWLWIHSLVNAAANVSKALFPSRTRSTANDFPKRGQVLRDLLDVKDSSPLHHQERALRNHLEHLDSRLEGWWTDDPRHNIARRVIGPLGGVVSGIDEIGMFEQFDPDLLVLAFQGDMYELRPVTDELRRLLATTTALKRQPWWKWDL